MKKLKELINNLNKEGESELFREQRNAAKFNSEIRKAAEGKEHDVAFIEQYARENSSSALPLIENAIKRAEANIAAEAKEAKIAELRNTRSDEIAKVREHSAAKDELSKQVARENPFECDGHPKPNVGIEEIDAYRDLQRQLSYHSDRESLASKLARRIEQQIETMKKSG